MKLISVRVAEYPCIDAHVSYYGEAELLALLCGQMSVENLPKHLCKAKLSKPWLNFMLCFAELSAPGEHPVNVPVSGVVVEQADPDE